MTNPDRPKLSDVLRQAGGADALRDAWDSTTAAADQKPIPAGAYECDLIRGEAFTSRQKRTPGYRLTFRVRDGEYAHRRVWHEMYITPGAMPFTKRDLAKLGVRDIAQLDRPLPAGIVCRVRVTLRRDDNDIEFNRVHSFDFLRVEAPEPDPFAPPETSGSNSVPPADADASFNFGANAEGGAA